MKYSLLALGVLLMLCQPVDSQTLRINQTYSDYFDTYEKLAVEQMRRHGIPASITLAQGVLESGAGQSLLARKSNNHFGIKCNHGWTGRKVYHDDDRRDDCFRAYKSVKDSYEDHSAFLVGNSRYGRLFQLKPTDYKGWARGLKACGYATSPTYADRLIEIIETYGLYRYDLASGKKARKGPAMEHELYEMNNNWYVVVKRGDTFQSIGKDVGISARRLAKYNERDKHDPLEVGEHIWLKKKRRKASKEYKNFVHRVSVGESMYSISQKYGIRLKSLYKINGLPPEYLISVGDELKVR